MEDGAEAKGTQKVSHIGYERPPDRPKLLVGKSHEEVETKRNGKEGGAQLAGGSRNCQNRHTDPLPE